MCLFRQSFSQSQSQRSTLLFFIFFCVGNRDRIDKMMFMGENMIKFSLEDEKHNC